MKKKLKIIARGWPWQYVSDSWANTADQTTGQKWGWNPLKVKGMGRFGGGWASKFGITISSKFNDVIIDLGIGSFRITYKEVK